MQAFERNIEFAQLVDQIVAMKEFGAIGGEPEPAPESEPEEAQAEAEEHAAADEPGTDGIDLVARDRSRAGAATEICGVTFTLV